MNLIESITSTSAASSSVVIAALKLSSRYHRIHRDFHCVHRDFCFAGLSAENSIIARAGRRTPLPPPLAPLRDQQRC